MHILLPPTNFFCLLIFNTLSHYDNIKFMFIGYNSFQNKSQNTVFTNYGMCVTFFKLLPFYIC